MSTVTATLIRPLVAGARVWADTGTTATVTEVGAVVLAVVDGERAPVPLDPGRWRRAMECDYCDRAADMQLVDGQPGDVLCRGHARAQHDELAAWVRPIPRTVIRQLFTECAPLG